MTLKNSSHDTDGNRDEQSVRRHTSPTLGLFRDACLRHGQASLAYLVIWALVLVNVALQAKTNFGTHGMLARAQAASVLNSLDQVGLVMAFVFSWLAVAANFRFMYGRGGAGFYATLPPRRRRLYLSLLAAAVVPLLLAVCVLTLLFAALSNTAGVDLGLVTQWGGTQALMVVAFGGIAAVCTQLAGRYTIGGVVYLMANLYAAVMGWGAWQLVGMCHPTIVGGDGPRLDWASPAYQIYHEFESNLSGEVARTVGAGTWGLLVAYAVIGVICAIVAGVLFGRRNLEVAGDAFAFRPVHGVVVTLFGTGAGLGITLVWGASLAASQEVAYAAVQTSPQAVVLGVVLVVCCVVCTILAEAVVGRSLRAVKSHVPTVVATTACGLALALVCVGDVIGATGYVPDASEVSSATANDVSDLELHDRASIRKLTRLHRSLIKLTQEGEATPGPDASDNSADASFDIVTLSYQMKDGSTVERQYNVPTPLAKWARTSEALDEFLGSDGIADEVVSWLNKSRAHDGLVSVDATIGADAATTQSESLSSEDSAAILDALARDVSDHGAACTSYLRSVRSTATADDYQPSISVWRMDGKGNYTSDSPLTVYLTKDYTPHALEWVSQRYGELLSAESSES